MAKSYVVTNLTKRIRKEITANNLKEASLTVNPTKNDTIIVYYGKDYNRISHKTWK